MEALVQEVGPERFWNGLNPALTHVFNAINVMDMDGVGFVTDALERICAETPDLPDVLVQRIELYTQQLKASRAQNAEHLQLMEQLGYDTAVPEKLRFGNVFPVDTLDVQELVHLLNVYSWICLSVSTFLLGRRWYLESASVKSAVVFQWRMLSETIHKGLLYDVQRHISGGQTVSAKCWWKMAVAGQLLFMQKLMYLLYTDGCLGWRQLPATLGVLYRMLLSPIQGYQRTMWRFSRLYKKHAGNNCAVQNAQIVNDFLANARGYIQQTNPAVDNIHFFSGYYFKDAEYD